MFFVAISLFPALGSPPSVSSVISVAEIGASGDPPITSAGRETGPQRRSLWLTSFPRYDAVKVKLHFAIDDAPHAFHQAPRLVVFLPDPDHLF